MSSFQRSANRFTRAIAYPGRWSLYSLESEVAVIAKSRLRDDLSLE